MTLVGATVTPRPGQTWPGAIAEFEDLTGETMQVRRVFESGVPSSVEASGLRHDLGARASVHSIKPSMATPLATLESLAASIAASGHPTEVIIYHEPVDNMSGADFIALYRRSAPSFRARGIPVGVCYTNWSVNLPYDNPRSALRHYWPGEAMVDFLAIDEYPVGGDFTSIAERTRRVSQFADARGVSLGLAEYGVESTWDVATCERWLRSVTDWGQERAARGTPLRWLAYFHSDVGGPLRLSHAEHIDAYGDTWWALGC